MKQSQTPYEEIGGAETVRAIVEAFYPRVQAHPLLKPIFPENIEPVMEKQRLFLTQFLGGPTLYSDRYGHPRLRARHLPFSITPARAEAWLACMHEALEEVGISEPIRSSIWSRLVIAAHHMVNRDDEQN